VQLNVLVVQNSIVRLNKYFQNSLHRAVIGCGHFGVKPEMDDKKTPTKEFLDKFSLESWENVLRFLVGTVMDKKTSSLSTLLEKSGLMMKQYDCFHYSGNELKITSAGFQFLLQDSRTQIWSLLLQYLELADVCPILILDTTNACCRYAGFHISIRVFRIWM